MNDKHLKAALGILAVVVVGLVFTVLRINKAVNAGGVNVFSGTTTVDSLRLKGNLTVDGTSSLTGATAFTGAMVLSSTLGVPAGLTTLSSLTATGTANFQSGLSSDGTIYTSSTRVGLNGTVNDLMSVVTSTINIDQFAGQGTTSSAITVTGAKAGDFCWASTPFTGTELYVETNCIASANTATLTFLNATSALTDPASGVFSVMVVSPPTN